MSVGKTMKRKARNEEDTLQITLDKTNSEKYKIEKSYINCKNPIMYDPDGWPTRAWPCSSRAKLKVQLLFPCRFPA